MKIVSNSARWVSASAAVVFGLAAAPSEAAIVFTLEQLTPTVFSLDGFGSINLGTSTPASTSAPVSDFNPTAAEITVGGFSTNVSYFNIITSGPSSFGTIDLSSTPLNANGNWMILRGAAGLIGLPEGYISGNVLAGNSVWSGNIQDLGVTPGTYVWNTTVNLPVGPGEDPVTLNDTITLNVIPEPSCALLVAMSSLALLRRRRKS